MRYLIFLLFFIPGCGDDKDYTAPPLCQRKLTLCKEDLAICRYKLGIQFTEQPWEDLSCDLQLMGCSAEEILCREELERDGIQPGNNL